MRWWSHAWCGVVPTHGAGSYAWSYACRRVVATHGGWNTPGAQSFSLYGKGRVPTHGLKAGLVGVPMHVLLLRVFNRMVQEVFLHMLRGVFLHMVQGVFLCMMRGVPVHSASSNSWCGE